MSNAKIFSALAVLAAISPDSPAAAQSVGAPAATYVFDSVAGSIRPLMGMAGSAFLGDAAIGGMLSAAIAPNGVAAIAVWPDRVEWIADPGNYAGSSQTMGGALASPEQIIWDRRSSAAALFSSSLGQVQFISMAGGAAAVRSASAPDSCTGPMKLLAADAAGGFAAVSCATAATQSPAQSLFFLQADSAARLVETPDAPVAAAFDESGALYIAGASSTVSLSGNPASDTSATLLFQDANAPNAAAAILVAGGAKVLYYADGVLRHIRVYDLSSFQQVDDFALDWQPTQFQPFSPTAFLMNIRSSASDPLLLLQTAPKRGVLFVPAGE